MNPTHLSILLGVLALTGAGILIIRGYNAKGILFTIGITLMILAYALGQDITKTPGGDPVADLTNHIYGLFESRGGGLGMIIMILIGFSAYMSHIGANDVVIRVLYKPLRHIRSPYILLAGGFLLGALMSLAINSATALGVFLMATLFPIMVRLGISAPSAAAICSSTTLVNLSPTAADLILAAKKAEADLVHFSFEIIIPMSIVALICVAIAHYYWQRYCDRREGLGQNTHDALETAEATALKTDAPVYYFILPFLPIAGLFLYNGNILPEIKLGGLVVLTILISALIEYLRSMDARKVYDGLEICYRGMAEGFSSVVVLLVAAGIFAHGLETIGFVKALLGAIQGDSAATIIMLYHPRRRHRRRLRQRRLLRLRRTRPQTRRTNGHQPRLPHRADDASLEHWPGRIAHLRRHRRCLWRGQNLAAAAGQTQRRPGTGRRYRRRRLHHAVRAENNPVTAQRTHPKPTTRHRVCLPFESPGVSRNVC